MNGSSSFILPFLLKLLHVKEIRSIYVPTESTNKEFDIFSAV
jgi:hypothetical protein